MSDIYQFHEIAGVQIDTISDEKAGIKLQVNRHGAEPISIARRGADGKWTGFLYRDGDTSIPAEGWKNHATLMGFFIHRLKDEHSLYRGKEIRGSTHSFLRHKDFDPPSVDAAAGALHYQMGPGQYTDEEYPFKARLNLTYALVMSGEHPELLVTFEFENLEPELPVHVSFGLHPGFGLTSLAKGQVILPQGTYIRHLAPGNFLSGETVKIEHPGGPMPFDKADLPGSFLLELADVPEAIFTVEDPAGHRRTLLDYHEAPYITIWSDGHDFVCVEPCWGLPDHQQQRPFEEKEGLQEIAPGKTLTRSFAIRPEII
jgi:galactose mutarotase-like enzyme